MQLNCKVIKKWQTPTHFYIKPTFQGYPPFLAKFLVPTPLPPGDSIFGRSYSHFNKEGSNYDNASFFQFHFNVVLLLLYYKESNNNWHASIIELLSCFKDFKHSYRKCLFSKKKCH